MDVSPSLASIWAARFGTSLPDGTAALLEGFLDRRSVRQFTDEPLSEGVVQGLVGAAQSAATSSNLQAYSMVSVQDPARRAQINAIAKNQVQIEKAAWFFVFVADVARVQAMAFAHGMGSEGTDTFELGLVAVIDATLAAERMACAAEALGLGTCYIGAVRNDIEGIARILELPSGCLPLFGLCLGHPVSLDPVKPRLPQSAVWHRETYRRNEDWRDLDKRMAPSYAHTRDPLQTWSQRTARRCQEGYVVDRLDIKDFTEKMRLFIR